jgi:hypothetical protein
MGCYFLIVDCISLGGCPVWVVVQHFWVWLSPPARSFSRILLAFSSVDVVFPRVAKDDIL